MIRFVLYSSSNTIVISDYPINVIYRKFGKQCELLTSINPDSLLLVRDRILRPYNGYKIVEYFVPPPFRHTEESKEKIRLARLGKPRPIESNRKTSEKLKGRSNFAGKKHTDGSKRAIADANIGNQKAAELYWCHNPLTGQETRVIDRNRLPEGFVLGRDYDAIESLYIANRARKKQGDGF